MLHCLLAPHPRASVSSPLACATLSCWRGEVTQLLPSLSSLVGCWGAQPWKPPLHHPSSFQFSCICSWLGGAWGQRGVGCGQAG